MAAKLENAERWRKLDEARTASAVVQIANSPDLKFLFASILDEGAVGKVVFDPDPIINAFNAGRQAFALDIKAAIDLYDEDLTHKLQKELAHEARIRTNASTSPPVGTSGRGDTDPPTSGSNDNARTYE